MSANSTTRANRSSKEKTSKTQPQQTQNIKDGTAKVKQATAEQLRLAQMMSDKQSVDDPELQEKVKQLMDLTQKSHDEVVIALHDCDNDLQRASLMLIDGSTDQGEWQETGKKRKRGTPAAANNQILDQTNSKPDFPKPERHDRREKSNDREVKEQSYRSESSSRGRRRDDGPPRFQRGGKSWRGKENEENERNRAESKGRDKDNRDRERSFERGRGRGRGGRGRGRGGGGGGGGGGGDGGGGGGGGRPSNRGTGEGNRFNRGGNRGGFDKGPHIDTWTNDQAIVERENARWDSNMSEDWTDDAWTGSLSETTVFTASSIGPVRKVETPAGEPFGQNGTIGPTNSLGTNSLGQSSSIIGPSNSLGHASAVGDRSSLGQPSVIGQSSSLGQTSAIGQGAIGQTNSLTGSLDLGALLQQKPSADVDMTSSQPTPSQTLSQSQFSKQATDALKSIVGIGTSSPSLSSSSQPQQIPNAMTPTSSLSSGVSPLSSGVSTSLTNQSPLSSVAITPPPQGHGPLSSQQPLQQRPKPARSKLPPPSKIPASAVEMPGMPGQMTTSLDVQFGFMTDFGSSNESSMPNTFTNSTVSTTGSAMTNHLPMTSQTSEPSSTTVSLMSSITPPKTSLSTMEQTTTRTSMFSSSANTTPTKDFTQSNINKSSGISPPEPIPFPSSQADRPKTSPLMSSQRPTAGSLASTDPVTTFSQTGYSSSYPSSRYQSHKPLTTSSYTHGTTSLPSHQSGLQQLPTTTSYQSAQNQYQSQYQSSSFQGQTSFSTGPSQSSLYQSANQPSYGGQSSSSYRDSQTGSSSYTGGQSYPTCQSSSSYQSSHSQSTAYGTGQSAASFPTCQSSSSSYQTSSTSYPASQNSAYPQTQTGPSYQTSQSGSTYPSSQSYSSTSQSSSSYQSSQTNSYQTGSTGSTGQSSGSYPSTQASSYPTTQSSSYPSTPSSSYSSTQASSYPTTQASSYPTTQASSYPTTQASAYQTTQASSYPVTQASSYTSTQTGSYPSTQASSYPSTQASTYASTQGSTYPSTQASSYSSTQASSFPSTQSSTFPSSQAASYQSSQSGSSYQSGQSSSSLPQTGSGYQSGQTASPYQPSVTQSSTSFTRDSQSNLGHQGTQNQLLGSHTNYSSTNHQSALQTSPMSASKLTESLSKISVKDTTNIDQNQTSFDVSTASTTATLSSTTTTTSSSLAAGTVSVSTALGLPPMTTAVTSALITTAKSSLTNTSGKAPPNLPPGVPPALLGPNFIMGQHMPPYFGLTAQQPTMYCNSYEDLQLLQQQQRLPLPGYYDAALSFQPPTSIAGSADQRTLGSVPYSGADGKLSRVDAQSPVQGSQTSQQQPTQSAHQQYINPAATLPPGYGYYIAQTGLVPNFSYTPTLFPQQVPPVSNAAHGNTTATTQFQKPAAYAASHAGYGTATYEELMQAQDYSKTGYGGISQAQNKVSVTSGIKVGGVNTSASDMTGAGAYTAKSHTQSFDKQGFHAGTPPPFNMAVPSGTQAGPMGAPTTPYAPYMPILQHQPQTQMLHHPHPQDSTGSSRSQQSSSQGKAGGSTKNYSTGYWNA